METYYVYLHVNGDVIGKSAYVVESDGAENYFEGDLVVKYWDINTPKDFTKMAIESMKLTSDKSKTSKALLKFME